MPEPRYSRSISFALVLFGAVIALLIVLLNVPRSLIVQDLPQPAEAPGNIPLTDASNLSVGGSHACALMLSGDVKCWGEDIRGQLGNGDPRLEQYVAVDVTGLPNGTVKAVAAGSQHTCALTMIGEVYCWGYDVYGQAGNGADGDADHIFTSPVKVAGLTDVKEISAGGDFTCALMNIGTVKCWGRDVWGQLGNGVPFADSLSSVNVAGLNNVIALSAGAGFVCAVRQDAAVWCWGNNAQGQLATGGYSPTEEAAPVLSIASGVTTISAGSNHACGLHPESGIWCWGGGGEGQLGIGSAPFAIALPANIYTVTAEIKSVVAGAYTTCAITTGGNPFCLGDDEYGKLGNGGSNVDSSTPDVLPTLTSGVKEISIGFGTVCALLQNSGVKCWGLDEDGAVGDGPDPLHKSLPVDVLTLVDCFALSFDMQGAGALPQALPDHLEGCPTGHYLAGAAIVLMADPDPDHRVNAWSSPIVANAGDTIAALTIPAADITATVTYGACHLITLAHSGPGSDPVAAPTASPGCPTGRFAAGEAIVLTATADAGSRVKSWIGASTTPAVASTVNSLTMPDAPVSVAVYFEPCFNLTISTAGDGDPIIVSPPASNGCEAGAYAEGESIVLVAKAAAGWHIAGWTGTLSDASTASTNSVLMPSSAKSVSVIYQEDEVEVEPHTTFLPAITK